jgi:signal transduction histidine kinase
VRQREEFVSIASHELKTPLTTVKGYVQLLAREIQQPAPDMEVAAEFLGELQGQLGRFEALIGDLLDASRAQQGRLDLRREEFDLSALAHDVLARFEHAAERTDRHRLVFVTDGPVVGEWDRARIDQVLTNLLSNALKYSPDGGDVTVEVHRRGGEAELVVADQGVGIAPEDRPALFQPFARISAAQTVEGTGLGLYITSQIIERHGGTISVDSRRGAGTTFRVRLPLSEGTGGAPAAAA